MAFFSSTRLADTLRENRLSAEYFDPRYVFRPSPLYKWERIGRVLLDCQYGISIAMNEEQRGFPIYRMNEIVDGIAGDTRKYAGISAAEFANFKLNHNDVLFNRTNSFELVGRTGIVKNPCDTVFASYLVRVVPDHRKVLPEFLTLYLNSDFGVGQIRRRAMPSINQANVSAYELRRVPIPLIDIPAQEELAELLNLSYAERVRAKQLYLAANGEVEKDMGIGALELPNRNFTSTPISTVIEAHRSDAEHFQPACEQLLAGLARRGRLRRLSNLLSFAKRGIQPTYASTGMIVINSKHVRKNYVIVSANRKGVVNLTDDPVYIHTGDVVINGTGIGTIGRASAYLFNETALPDNHVTVLRTTTIVPAYLSVFLNTVAGQLQVSKHQRGSSGQIELYPADIGKFLIWEGSEGLQEKVGAMIASAHQCDLRAKQLMSEAREKLNHLLKKAVAHNQPKAMSSN